MSFVCPKWDNDLPSSPFDGLFQKVKKKRKRKNNIKENTCQEQNGCGAFVKLNKSLPETVQNSAPNNKIKRKNVVDSELSEIPRKKKKVNPRTENSELNTKRKSKNKFTNSDIRQNLTIGLENIISKKCHKQKRPNNPKQKYERNIPITIDNKATTNKISNISPENSNFPSGKQKADNQIVNRDVKLNLDVMKNGVGLANISEKCHKQKRLNKSKLKYGRKIPEEIDSKATTDKISKTSPENQILPSVKQKSDNQIGSGDVKSKLDVNRNIPYKISELKKFFNKSLCTTNIKTNKTPTNSLRDKMMKKLQSSHFRYLNEQLYCSDSKKSMQYFHQNTSAFQEYHKGYQMQVQQWPLNPLDRIINTLKKKKTETIIADFGCGEALLAKSLPNYKVYSFDFVATSDLVTPCDMANTPLQNESVNVVVFCLSLMGDKLNNFFKEANRVLMIGGTLMIAEVESRIENIDHFIQGIKKFGFVNNYKDLSHKIFYFLYFKKEKSVKNISKLPEITLKPCMYKKR